MALYGFALVIIGVVGMVKNKKMKKIYFSADGGEITLTPEGAEVLGVVNAYKEGKSKYSRYLKDGAKYKSDYKKYVKRNKLYLAGKDYTVRLWRANFMK